MATAVLPQIESTRPQAIAPWWHTTSLIAFFALLAAGGAVLQHGARAGANLVEHRPDVIPLYLSLIAGEWGLVYYVWKGLLQPHGIGLIEFSGGRWTSLRAVFRDVALGFGIWVLWSGIAFVWARWFGAGHAASISTLLPRGPLEAVLWVLLSISAGISEELVFRGYLQRQLTAFTGHVSLALLLQAAIFGIGHGYQGVRNCIAIALYGAIFTLLALWRKSLWPGMIAHVWSDIAGGLLGL